MSNPPPSPAVFPAASILLAVLILSGCRDKVESVHPSGKPKVIRTYGLWGGEDSAHLKRERAFFFNGKPERDARYRRGVLHGPYLDYWHNGQKKSQGLYQNGRKEGPWEFYFNEFTVASKGAFRDDRKEGPWTEYWEGGNLRAQGDFAQGQETGAWKSWSAKGDLLLENSCFERNPEGHYLSYHATRTPKEEYRCARGLPTGPYTRKTPEGEVEERGRFDSLGKKEGTWETFHPGGAPASRRVFRGGTEEDSLLAWDAAGRVRQRGFFQAGKGEVLSYDSLGRLTERKQLAMGLPEGVTSAYFPDGKRKSVVSFRNGQAVMYRRWHANGRLAAEGGFAEGKRSGTWTLYGDKGQPLDESPYVAGRIHGERKMYDSTGALMQVQRYEHGYPAEGRFPGGLKEKFSGDGHP